MRGDRDYDLEAADDRTLRLATPDLDGAALDGFLKYQRLLLEKLSEKAIPAPQRLEQGRAYAVAQSGLAAARVHRLEAFARDVAGRLLVRRKLEQRQAELAQVAPQTPIDQKRRDELAKELRGRDPLPLLRRRYGDAAVDLVLSRQEDVLALHEGLERAVRELS